MIEKWAERVINRTKKSFNNWSLKLTGQLKLIVDKIGDNDESKEI